MKKIVMLIIASFAVGMAGQASAQGLTRAEVKQQLVQAEAQGLLPSNGVNYPPNARAVARNKAAFEAREQGPTATSSYGGVADGNVSN